MTETPTPADGSGPGAPGFDFPPPIEAADANRTATDSPPVASPFAFPPMANPYVVGIASAPIGADADFLADLAAQASDARSSLAEMMSQAVTQANTGYFRFHLTDIHEDGQPSLTVVSHGDRLPGLSESASSTRSPISAAGYSERPSTSPRRTGPSATGTPCHSPC